MCQFLLLLIIQFCRQYLFWIVLFPIDENDHWTVVYYQFWYNVHVEVDGCIIVDCSVISYRHGQ